MDPFMTKVRLAFYVPKELIYYAKDSHYKEVGSELFLNAHRNVRSHYKEVGSELTLNPLQQRSQHR